MHFGDYTFIFLLALVLFGPKKLPEIGRQLGKLLAEFRRASNEFKFQIQEELRTMEDEERRRKLAEQQAAALSTTSAATTPLAIASTTETVPTILPPSTGTPVAAAHPYATPVETDPSMDAEATEPETTEKPSSAEGNNAATAAGTATALSEDVERKESSNGVYPPETEPVHHD